MRLLTTSIFVSLIIYMSSCTARDVEPILRDGLFTFAVTDLDGNPVTSKDAVFNGKVVLVDIWGTWCPPCRESIPYLEDLQKEYANKGLVIIGIAVEEEEDTEKRRESLKAFVKEQNIQYRILDGGSLENFKETFSSFKRFKGFPTMIIIGSDGAIAHANTVFVPRELPKIRKEVEKALKQSSMQK